MRRRNLPVSNASAFTHYAFLGAVPIAPGRPAVQCSTRTNVTRPSPRTCSVTRCQLPLGANCVRLGRHYVRAPLGTIGVQVPGSVLDIVSSVIGVLVLLGSVLYKVPQVLRIVRRRSARGISVLYYLLETVGMIFSAVYFARRAYPIVSYGESVSVMLTNLIILALIVKYERLPTHFAVACFVLMLAVTVYLVSPAAPLTLLQALLTVSIVVTNLAKVPQILLNQRRRDTGELAPATLGLQLLGNAARVFTTVAQVGDVFMLTSFLVSFVFNTVLFGQWLIFSQARSLNPNASKANSAL